VPASTDAIRLVAAAHAGELPECIIEGPLALDLALNKSACEAEEVQDQRSVERRTCCYVRIL
jgi:phosphotransacetylase